MMLLEDMLSDVGCEVVGLASSFDDALEKAESLSFDLAILDGNLMGKQTFPIADALLNRGVPFVFAGGYGPAGIPACFQATPVLQKPFQQAQLESVLQTTFSGYPQRRNVL